MEVYVWLLQFEDDSQAFGVGGMPNPPSRSPSVASTESLFDSSSEDTSSDMSSEAGTTPEAAATAAAQQRQRRRRWREGQQEHRRGPVRRLQQINAAVIAAGVAFALGRSTSRGRLL